ncbi:XRE family transcriptional regulator [Halomonas sp. 1390]|uniref:XRE family transcriptional regulator n=1 Tax=Halomonas sp. B23F22_3 TaxID=3459516 RepID=UPI00373F1AF8
MDREVQVAGSTIGDRIKQARQQANMTQPELAKACRWNSQGRVSNYERGLREPKSSDVVLLAKALGVSEGWLWTGEDVGGNVTELRPKRSIEGNAEMLDHELIEGDEPLRPDEVMLPMFREVEFAAGEGCTQVIENHGAEERFSLPRLSRAGVQPENAALAVAKGDSMMPAINDGATIGIDKGCRGIIDGKVYALDHGGMLRIKRLYRMPLGRVRVVSENSEEYPEEVYSLADPDAPRILGRVFWWENFD